MDSLPSQSNCHSIQGLPVYLADAALPYPEPLAYFPKRKFSVVIKVHYESVPGRQSTHCFGQALPDLALDCQTRRVAVGTRRNLPSRAVGTAERSEASGCSRHHRDFPCNFPPMRRLHTKAAGDLIVRWQTTMSAAEIRRELFIALPPRSHSPGYSIFIAQSVQNRAAYSILREGGEVSVLSRLVPACGGDESQYSAIYQVVTFHVGRHIETHARRDAPDQREELDDEVVPNPIPVFRTVSAGDQCQAWVPPRIRSGSQTSGLGKSEQSNTFPEGAD